MTRAQMHKHVHRAAALELGYELPPERSEQSAADSADSDGAGSARPAGMMSGQSRRLLAVDRRSTLRVGNGGLAPPTEVHAPRRSPVVVLAPTASTHETT